MSYENAIKSRKEEIEIMKKKLENGVKKEEEVEIQKRIVFVEESIEKLMKEAGISEVIEKKPAKLSKKGGRRWL